MSNQTNFQIFSFYIIDFWEWALVNIMQLLALWQSHKMQSHSKTTKWKEVAGFVSESSYCQHPYLSVFFFLLIILYMGIMLYKLFYLRIWIREETSNRISNISMYFLRMSRIYHNVFTIENNLIK